MHKLTPRQERFVHEYLVDLNAAQAAIRSGYSEKTARSIGQRLLTNVDVQAAIQQARAKIEKKTDISIERCLKEYGRIAFLDPIQVFDSDGSLKNIQDMPEDARRAIAGIEITALFGKEGQTGTLSKIRLNNKKDALDSIMRHLGGFDDKMKIQIEDGVRKILEVLPAELQGQVMALLTKK